MRIERKAQMYDLLRLGRLGNSFRIWTSPAELLASGYKGKVGVRLVGTQGRLQLPYKTQLEVPEAVGLGLGWAALYQCEVRFSEASPDEHILWQGELTRGIWGWHVEYSRVKTHMRAAFAQERKVLTGLAARSLLEETLTPSSMDDISALFEIYPDHVMELTVYDICVGPYPDRNYVCWEIRSY